MQLGSVRRRLRRKGNRGRARAQYTSLFLSLYIYITTLAASPVRCAALARKSMETSTIHLRLRERRWGKRGKGGELSSERSERKLLRARERGGREVARPIRATLKHLSRARATTPLKDSNTPPFQCGALAHGNMIACKLAGR